MSNNTTSCGRCDQEHNIWVQSHFVGIIYLIAFFQSRAQAFRNPPRDSKRATERSFPPFFGFENRPKANRCCCCSTIISTVVHPKTDPSGAPKQTLEEPQNRPLRTPKQPRSETKKTNIMPPKPLPCPIGKLPRNLGGMFL